MKNRIYYSPEARRDLDDIWDYIVSELQNRSAAERVTDRILYGRSDYMSVLFKDLLRKETIE